MRLFYLLAGLALPLASCGATTSETKRTEIQKTKPSFELKPISGNDVFAMTIPDGVSADELAGASREACNDKEFCQVYGWQSEIDVALAFPMTDREVSTLAFRYAQNRSTGYESRTWDCKIWPRTDVEECI